MRKGEGNKLSQWMTRSSCGHPAKAIYLRVSLNYKATQSTYLDHTWVFTVAIFHVHSFQFMCEESWGVPGVPLSPFSPLSPFRPAGPWTPGSPFAPFFSVCTRWSLGSSLSWTALVPFGPLTSITAMYSRGTRHAMHTGNTICPWLSTIAQWQRL